MQNWTNELNRNPAETKGKMLYNTLLYIENALFNWPIFL